MPGSPDAPTTMSKFGLPGLVVALAIIGSSVPAEPVALSPGALLATLAFEGGSEGNPCPGAAETHFFDVVAIQVPISYNHWGDFDPQGRLFVLASQEAALRRQVAEELAEAGLATVARAVAAATDAVQGNPARFPAAVLTQMGATVGNVAGVPNLEPFDVSPLVQPLVLRVHVGDCVQLNLTNQLPEPASMAVHRARTPPGQGSSFGQDANDLTLPGQRRSYIAYVPPLPGMEGAHFLDSHADARFQTKHGLFGAILAEPPGSAWTAADGGPLDAGQEAIVTSPDGSDFREYAVFLHDEVELLDRRLNPIPLLSPYGEYGPGTKAINLRTEPFMNRFELHDRLSGDGALPRGADKSQGYGSYTYGDPAQFIPRAYVGDPTKFRLVNAGPGQHHVFHLHGGGDRWRLNPVSDDTQFDDGLVKQNPVVKSKSDRVDVQSLGPGESFNLEIEGGAGGVQQSVGDFLYHCHIVEHYVAGMFSMWRVFNTLQPDLAELPDRAGGVPGSVSSTGLLGQTMPDGTVLTPENLAAWVERQLPPPGVPADDEAAVWDWAAVNTSSGLLYYGEPETNLTWPNYRSPAPGTRPELRFNPVNGRPSYPMLTPHLGKRPPFAPGHGPAPYLGPDVGPGRADGLCPAGARPLDYNVVALSVPVKYNDLGDEDPQGEVFVLAEDKPAVVAGTKPAKNLVIRANQGDCVDVLLTSQLVEPEGGHSKVNMHTHMVQFDVQASDGVITGYNYEQSVRPAATTGTALAAPAAPGDAVIRVVESSRLRPGTLVGVGLTESSAELRTVLEVFGDEIILDAPLANPHRPGARVGSEFVRYRWYPDVEVGMVYWHDHVDGLNSWRRGLFGGLVVEPAGSWWRDPKSGRELREGTVADIIAPQGSFRELVAQLQDTTAGVAGRNLASFNLRSAPFDRRGAGNPLSSTGNGDPATDILSAYVGDPVVVRLQYGANANSRAVGTFTVPGHRFPLEGNNPGSALADALSFGISSQHNLWLDCGAGGCGGQPGDYLYGMTQPDLLERGAWGILRVEGAATPDLLPLPDRGPPEPQPLPPGPVRRFDVVAMGTNVTLNERFSVTAPMRIFALAEEESAIRDGRLRPMPLVLRALPGERIEVRLANRLPDPVTLHAGLVLADPADGAGVPVGRNPDVAVPPGDARTFTWYADREVGVAYLTSLGRPADDALDGLYGALVVEPAGSRFDAGTGMTANVTLADGTVVREHVVLYASNDPAFMGSVMPYTVDVQGPVTVNYRTEPLAPRLGTVASPTGSEAHLGGLGMHPCQLNAETCSVAFLKETRVELRNPLNGLVFAEALGPPETPLLRAAPGQGVVLRSLGGAGDQLHVVGVGGHLWARDPSLIGSDLVDAQTLGTGEASNAWFDAGSPGDYPWGMERAPFREAGAWGVLRVRDP